MLMAEDINTEDAEETEKAEAGVIEKIKQLTGHGYVKLTGCGDSAIYAALSAIKNKDPDAAVLMPDQGAWHTYEKHCMKLLLEYKKIKTDRGIIILEELKRSIAEIKDKKKRCAFILTSFAGYYAAQPMKEISDICRKNSCMLIEDVSGSIGLLEYSSALVKELNLCAGLADICVCSFGKWKPISIGKGGFISFKDALDKKNPINLNNLKSSLTNADLNILLHKLENINKRYAFLFRTAGKIKKELADSNIFHRNLAGLNVIIGFADEDEKNKLIKYCKDNNYEYVMCPKNIRVEENAVSIELKRLEEA